MMGPPDSDSDPESETDKALASEESIVVTGHNRDFHLQIFLVSSQCGISILARFPLISPPLVTHHGAVPLVRSTLANPCSRPHIPFLHIARI